jgi:hypothetical protein
MSRTEVVVEHAFIPDWGPEERHQVSVNLADFARLLACSPARR